MQLRIILFAKAPRAGDAKTRLIPALGAQGAAQLAARLLRRTVAEALAAKLGPLELCAAPAPGTSAWAGVRLAQCMEWSDQGGGDLGGRMARAASRHIEASDKPGAAVLLIGSDCPDLDRHRLCAAAKALETTDSVIIPAFDGGYVLLGLRKFDPSLFQDIVWSTDTVAQDTLRRIAALGWSVTMLDPLGDIDVPADLARLPEHLMPCKTTE